MKILKRPDNLVFDTENKNIIEYIPSRSHLVLKQLEHLHTIALGENSIHSFLSKQFLNDKEHPIFKDFGNSYFYIYEE